MTNFKRFIFLSIIWLLSTFCEPLITIRKNHWLVEVIYSFFESASEYESVFQLYVWIIIHKMEELYLVYQSWTQTQKNL